MQCTRKTFILTLLKDVHYIQPKWLTNVKKTLTHEEIWSITHSSWVTSRSSLLSLLVHWPPSASSKKSLVVPMVSFNITAESNLRNFPRRTTSITPTPRHLPHLSAVYLGMENTLLWNPFTSELLAVCAIYQQTHKNKRHSVGHVFESKSQADAHYKSTDECYMHIKQGEFQLQKSDDNT